MSRIDRVARWAARDILRQRGVTPSPEAMSQLMPMCYVVAAGQVNALAEMNRELAGELADGQAVIRVPVFAGTGVAEADLAEWEAELSRDDPEIDGGV